MTSAQIGPGLVVNFPVPGGSTGLKEPASDRLSPEKYVWAERRALGGGICSDGSARAPTPARVSLLRRPVSAPNKTARLREEPGRFEWLRFQLASNASRLPSTILTRSPCLNAGLAP